MSQTVWTGFIPTRGGFYATGEARTSAWIDSAVFDLVIRMLLAGG